MSTRALTTSHECSSTLSRLGIRARHCCPIASAHASAAGAVQRCRATSDSDTTCGKATGCAATANATEATATTANRDGEHDTAVELVLAPHEVPDAGGEIILQRCEFGRETRERVCVCV